MKLKKYGGAEDNAESTGDEVQDTAASVESDPTDQTSEDEETLQISRTIRLLIQREFTTELP